MNLTREGIQDLVFNYSEDYFDHQDKLKLDINKLRNSENFKLDKQFVLIEFNLILSVDETNKNDLMSEFKTDINSKNYYSVYDYLQNNRLNKANLNTYLFVEFVKKSNEISIKAKTKDEFFGELT